MKRDIRVAAVSMECPGGQEDLILDRVGRLVRELSRQGSEVLCFPEACLTGYSVGPEVDDWARPLSSPVVQAVRTLAVENGVWLLAGLMERGEGKALHVTHLAFSPDGAMALYRKAHLSPQEQRIFVPGDTPGIFSLGEARGGMALCFETHFPEWIARLALLGVEVLFFPHASPRETPQEKRDRWLRYLPARAYDNSAFVVACNQAGRNEAGLTFPAVALIMDPKGRVMASREGEREAIAVATLEAGEIARVRSHPMAYFLGQRRPELYGMNQKSEVGGQRSDTNQKSEVGGQRSE